MTQNNSANTEFTNLQLNKLKRQIRNDTEVTLNLSSNVFDDSNEKTNFPYKLLLTDKQVSRLRNTFENNYQKLIYNYQNANFSNSSIRRIS